MKGFNNILGLLPSSWKVVVQDLSLVKKRRTTDTGQQPSSMTLNFINNKSRNPAARKTLRDDGLITSGRTVNTSILSSPKVSVGDPLLLTKENDRFPNAPRRQTLGNDNTLIPARTANHFCAISRGFTLIELLVVVLIIGILAAVAVPQYQTAVDKARYSKIIPMTRALKDATEVYYMANGTYNFVIGDIDISGPAGCQFPAGDNIVLC